MTLLPRTLFGRNVMLILALIAFEQLTSALLLREFVQKPRIDQLAVIAVRQIDSIAAMLTALSAEQRVSLMAQMNQVHTDNGPELRIATQIPASSAAILPSDLLMAQFAQLVAGHLKLTAQNIRWSASNGTLWAPIQISNQTYWIGIHGMQTESELWRVWLGVSLFAGLLAVCGAFLIQRRINQPLQNLVTAATQLAKGETPAVLAEDVPTEIATVSRSFNHMAASLAQVDRERTLMLAGVSHDLRTPLAKLRLGIEILSTHGDADVIANMTRSTEQMDAIIDQFLNYARIGSTEAVVTVNLNDMVRDCAAAYAAHGHTLLLDLDDTLPHLPLRRQAMERLLSNLVENALRYGQPDFKIRTSNREHCIQLCVIDHGPGIPCVELDAMKQAFTRGSSSRSGPPGAGLGLAIVDRIAQLHGGQLTLLANDGGGLQARVTLPIAE
jgi:two-component system, OmpR family, osmolarity sensor histidine kinase EnvZ